MSQSTSHVNYIELNFISTIHWTQFTVIKYGLRIDHYDRPRSRRTQYSKVEAQNKIWTQIKFCFAPLMEGWQIDRRGSFLFKEAGQGPTATKEIHLSRRSRLCRAYWCLVRGNSRWVQLSGVKKIAARIWWVEWSDGISEVDQGWIT